MDQKKSKLKLFKMLNGFQIFLVIFTVIKGLDGQTTQNINVCKFYSNKKLSWILF